MAQAAVKGARAAFPGFTLRYIEPLQTDPRRTAFFLVPARLQKPPDDERLARFCRLARAAMETLQPHVPKPPDAGREAETANRWVREWLGVVVGLAEAGLLPGHETRKANLPIDTRAGASVRELSNVFDAAAAALEYLTTWSGHRPSIAQVRAVLEASNGLVKALKALNVSKDAYAWRQEDRIHKPLDRLVDALAAIRWATGLVERWPPVAAQALKIVEKSTDRLAVEWGWTFEFLPPEERRDIIESLESRFEDTRRQYYQAAIALRDVRDGDRRRFHGIAKKGLRLGYGKTMDLAQARLRWDELEKAYLHTPRLGKVVPGYDAKVVSKLLKACNHLRTQLQSAKRSTPPPTRATAPGPEPVADEGGRPLKPPSNNAITCYRLYLLKGMKQTDIAVEVYHDRDMQGQVSRDIKSVKEWVKAGNVLPDLEFGRPKTATKDSRRLDRGPRSDRGRRRKRRDYARRKALYDGRIRA
jgi:hypothetical protein